MRRATRIWPLLTAMHRYDKSISTHGRGQGEMIDAPILAYLIETSNGRILYDVGCDYRKIHDKAERAKFYDPATFQFGAPDMRQEQRIPSHLARLGLGTADVDVIFISHLHFDHAGGLRELKQCGCGAEVHVQQDEMEAACSGDDPAYFKTDFLDQGPFRLVQGEYEIVQGVHAVSSPGHTAGHMSMLIELPQGPPVLLAGDAADLAENLEHEIAPGACWKNSYEQAVDSIRKLKQLAKKERAEIWPNHDLAFYRTLKDFHE